MRVIARIRASRNRGRWKSGPPDSVIAVSGADPTMVDEDLGRHLEVGDCSTEPLADLLATAAEQMDAISRAARVRGVAGDMPEVADYLRELVEHGQELAAKAGRVIQDTPLEGRSHQSFSEAEVSMTNTEFLLVVAITTTNEASHHVRRMNPSSKT